MKAKGGYRGYVARAKAEIAAEDKARHEQQLAALKAPFATFMCGVHTDTKVEFKPGQLVPAQMVCPSCGRIISPRIQEPTT